MARVLVVAYACEPHSGSEPGVGWSWTLAAAGTHDVVLLTRANNVAAVERQLQQQACPRIRVVGFDLGRFALRAKRSLPGGLHIYYLVWQWRAARVVERHATVHNIQLIHHLTFAADWQPTWASSHGSVPMVWGPVAGATYTPRELRHLLPPADRMKDRVRRVATVMMRRAAGMPAARKARVTIAGSQDTMQVLLPHAQKIFFQPNVAVPDGLEVWRENRGGHVLFAGRLLAWKGALLAVEVISGLPHRELHVYGDGPARNAMQQRAQQLGCAERVVFHGKVHRGVLLKAMSESAVLLAPSFHESIGWTVAEAVSVGLPVAAIRHGGPIDLVPQDAGVLVPFAGDVATALAAAVEACSSLQTQPGRWTEGRLSAFIDSVYRAALARDPGT